MPSVGCYIIILGYPSKWLKTAISVTAYFSLTSEETPVKIFEAARIKWRDQNFLGFFWKSFEHVLDILCWFSNQQKVKLFSTTKVRFKNFVVNGYTSNTKNRRHFQFFSLCYLKRLTYCRVGKRLKK